MGWRGGGDAAPLDQSLLSGPHAGKGSDILAPIPLELLWFSLRSIIYIILGNTIIKRYSNLTQRGKTIGERNESGFTVVTVTDGEVQERDKCSNTALNM